MRNSVKKAITGAFAFAVLASPFSGTISYNLPVLSTPLTASAIQVSGNFKGGYKLTGNQSKDMVGVANKQIGLTGSYYGYTEHWCADWICELSREVGISTSVIPFKDSSSCNCSYLYNRLVNKCKAKIVSTPKVGDLLFFQWDGSTSTANLDHVAIVTSVNGNKLTYVGGNQGSGYIYNTKVSKVTVTNYKKDKTITKIVRPNYKTTSSSSNTSNKTSTSSSSTKKTYTIKSSSGAFVRSSPKIAANNKVAGLAKGSVIVYDKKQNADGYVWYHIIEVKSKKSGSWGKKIEGYWVANV